MKVAWKLHVASHPVHSYSFLVANSQDAAPLQCFRG